MKTNAFRSLLIIIVSVLFGYAIGVTKIHVDISSAHPNLTITSKEPPPGLTNLDLTQFWTVLSKLQTMYYDKSKLDNQKILDGAISGMVNSLDDPYTLYLPPQQNDSFKQQLSGQFEGIGAELGIKDKEIVIVAPLDGSPSQKAGLKPGDAIVKVNDEFTAGWDLNKAVDKIRGPKGTSVKLAILHKGADKPVDVKITRDTITVKSVTSWVKKVKDVDGINKSAFANPDVKVAYIRLSQFGDNTNQEWLPLTNQISQQMQSDPSIKGVILDLRNNPGGYLTDAVFIASEFIKDGIVVQQEDANGDKTAMNVSRKGLLTDAKLIVLINKGSASASEIVSGALRDHDRATLVGETSFGKGTIQQAEDLGGGAGLHVTIAKWLTPNSIWVGNGKNGTGLTPDVPVTLDDKDPSHDTQLEKAMQLLVQ